jgi:uncharacterized protein DUF1259
VLSSFFGPARSVAPLKAAWTQQKSSSLRVMVMGDMVLFEDEVNPVMNVALDKGLEVTALHNHFFFDEPKVYFMHIGGEGPVDILAEGVRAIFDKVKEIRATNAQPTKSFGSGQLPEQSSIDGEAISQVFGQKGDTNNGMYKVTIGREVEMDGHKVGNTMGVNTWAAFQGTPDDALVVGDFAVLENELQAVLKALRIANFFRSLLLYANSGPNALYRCFG